MKLIEAIQLIDIQKPNNCSDIEKIRWLSKLDGIIKKEIINTHEGGELINFTQYDENTPGDTTLLCEAPYDDLYIYWLESQIDYYNGEITKYLNSSTMFNNRYGDYTKAYNRGHMPKSTKIKFF